GGAGRGGAATRGGPLPRVGGGAGVGGTAVAPSRVNGGRRRCGARDAATLVAACGASAAPHPPLEARGAAAHRQLELADGGDALLGQAVRGLVGRDAVALGDLEDAGKVVVDRAHHPHRAFAVVAVDLQRHVHHAAGVDRVVGRVQHAAALELVADRVVGQLVVGRAAHHLGLDPRQGLLVERAAQGAGRVHVHVHVVDVVRGHGLGAEFAHRTVDAVLVDVGDEQFGATLAQQL